MSSQVQQTEPAIEVLVPLEGEAGRIEGRTPWQLFWARFRRDKVAVGAGLAVIALITLALTAPLLAHFVIHRGPMDQDQSLISDIGVPLYGPGKVAWFGVDTLGRDVFVRSLYGARAGKSSSWLAGMSVYSGERLWQRWTRKPE